MTLKISSKNEFIQIKKVKPPKKKRLYSMKDKKYLINQKLQRFIKFLLS